jgi:hypothetical protein
MSSAYGKILVLSEPDKTLFPIKDRLQSKECQIRLTVEKDKPQLHRLLNLIIKEGKTYPQENELDFDQFTAYFGPSFVCVDETAERVLGAFYIKPNYPGRASHICNGVNQ